MKKRITVTVVKEDEGYSASATVAHKFIGTEGTDLDELKKNIKEATKLAFAKEGIKAFDFKYEFDIASFFSHYKVINAKALSSRIGMNQSLLAQYIKGNKIPSQSQTKRILNGVKEIGRELVEVEFI